MMCAAHLALQAESDEVNLPAVPSAVTFFGGRALCLHCFWMALDEATPKVDDQ